VKLTKSTVTHLLFVASGLLLVLLVNARQIARPPFDANNFRQCQTLSTVELFYEKGIDILKPPTNYQGEPGVFVLEFPLFQAASALLYHVFGENVAIVRLFNILLTLASTLMIYLITRELLEPNAAVLAAFLFVCAPLNLMYMSSTLSDPFCIFLALCGFYVCLKICWASDDNSFFRYLLFATLAWIVVMLKGLYLFPVLVLLAVAWLLEGKLLWRPGIRVLVCFAPAAVCFLLWNRHAANANAASFFTAGIEPSSHLGISTLLSPAWYVTTAKRLLWECVGPLGGLLAVTGWFWSLLQLVRSKGASRHRVALITFFSTTGYWLTFANITFPHNYYSLIAVPFLSIAAADTVTRLCSLTSFAVRRLAITTVLFITLGLATGATSAAFFLLRRGFHQEHEWLTLQKKAGGAFQRWGYAMIFIHANMSPGKSPLHNAPAALYALGLRGTAKFVADTEQAEEIWRDYEPHYRHLRYVVFFGVSPSPEITSDFSRKVVSDKSSQIYGFERGD
jgi:4-amino-4-deoxy-L-arabinose transferase-like glycosyltransferase